MLKILFSAQEHSVNYALEELKDIFYVHNTFKLSNSIILAEIDCDLNKFYLTINKNKPIFIRYIIPVIFEYKINNTIDYCFMDQFNLNQNDCYVLHFNLLNNDNLNKKDELKNILNYFNNKNIVINPKKANIIINITISSNTLYFGIIDVKYSLSSWNFGECRFKYEKDTLSRAEFKLLEAFEYFKIDISNYKKALDLGAAPGGWTKILLNNGLNVIAIDPADLDESLLKNKNLFHYKDISQHFFKEYKNKMFDIIVNDMKMDAKKSLRITDEASNYLNKNGIVIMTLKLNPNREFQEVKECVKIIEKKHKIIGIHQLFHNRAEVTVVFKN